MAKKKKFFFNDANKLLNALWWPEWGGNTKKEELGVYVWLIHFAVQ